MSTKKRQLPRNPVAGANRRINRHQVQRDRTKYSRKDKVKE